LTELSFAALQLSLKARILHSKSCTATDRALKERHSQSGVKPPHSKESQRESNRLESCANGHKNW
jgi:hypothetical protein